MEGALPLEWRRILRSTDIEGRRGGIWAAPVAPIRCRDLVRIGVPAPHGRRVTSERMERSGDGSPPPDPSQHPFTMAHTDRCASARAVPWPSTWGEPIAETLTPFP